MRVEEQGFHASREIIYRLLQEYVKKKDLVGGKEILSAMIHDGLESISVLGDHLIRLFASCGSLVEANYVFCTITRPTIFTWNSIILAHANLGEGKRALELYQKMQEVGSKPDKVTFLGVLKSCGSTHSINQGRLVHGQIISNNFESESSIGNTLIDMYAKCGSLMEAYRVFVRLSNHNVVSWTVIIAAYAQCNDCIFALQLYDKMLQEGITPNKATFMATLKACSNIEAAEQGKIIHEHIVESGYMIDKELGSTLLDMYSKCGSLQEARKVFNELPIRDPVSWGAMIAGYAQHGAGFDAIGLYESMQEEGLKPDKFIYSSILKACASAKAIGPGGLIHEQVVKNGLHLDLIVGTALVDMHAQCGNLKMAQKVFDELPESNEVSWGALIKGYVQHGYDVFALQLYQNMQHEGLQPSKAIYVCTLKACGNIRALKQGRLIHDQIVQTELESDTVIGSSIIDLYAQCGCLVEAHLVFDKLQDCDKVSWGVLFEGYLRHGQGDCVLHLFKHMQMKGVKPDTFICMCVLRACGSTHNLRLIHDQIIENGFEEDDVLGSTLIDMYAKYGSLDEAHKVFKQLRNRNVASWSAMIGGLAKHGQCCAAFNVFEEMQQAGIQPNKVTYLCLLKACSNMNAIRKGRLAHDEIMRSGLQFEVIVGNALVDMYANCGHVEEAQRVFDSLSNQDVVSWGTMIAAYAKHGHDVLALELFGKMQQKGLKPTEVSFLCILRACSNLGAIEQGKLIHNLVLQSGFEWDGFIGSSLVDMYAKCGHLVEAHKVFDDLQWQDVMSWGALIAGYAQYGNSSFARKCFAGMQLQGLKPNELIFTNMITACSHEGLLEEGHGYFKSMREDHGIASSLEHYSCMVDLLGRIGCLKAAYDLLQTTPMPPDLVVWRSLLSGCMLHDDTELGVHCFDGVTQSASYDASAHMLMSNIYADMHKWHYVKHLQELKSCAGVQKKPGLAWIEIGNKVLEFVVGANTQSANEDMFTKLKRLSRLNKWGGYLPHLGLVMDPNLADHREGYGEFTEQQNVVAQHEYTLNFTTK